MFPEPHVSEIKTGWIEVICGSMFSGKTEELIRRVKRVLIANQKVEIFKPKMDTRYNKENIISHDERSIQSRGVNSSREILKIGNDVKIVAIDEAQFFDEGIVEAAEELADRGVRVIISGLDLDYQGKPFGPMPKLLACAQFVTKVHAICVVCGNLATRSFRKAVSDEKIFLGAKDAYEPRCRKCFHNGMKKIKSAAKKR